MLRLQGASILLMADKVLYVRVPETLHDRVLAIAGDERRSGGRQAQALIELGIAAYEADWRPATGAPSKLSQPSK